MKRTMLRFLSAALTLLLGLSACLPAGAEAAASRIEDDGLIRVYLKSLADPNALTLTLKGVYTVENDAGFRFEPDTELTVFDGGDGVYLSTGGLTIAMGGSMTLTRQASDSAEKGIYIAESEKDTLYQGDLAITRKKNGGLRSVLTISMEDYLCGVVAYEMSNSWPIEALKAQAVAARTYAMQRKWSAGDKDYDVVDTSGDQVYKGYDAEYTSVVQAVRETEGVVGTYKGAFATCYYTASNGGEVALPEDVWGGGGDYGYLERRDDPYDLENPNSLVASASIAPDGSGNAALRAMLDEALLAEAARQNLNTKGLQLEQIISIEPFAPAVEGSRMYTKLRFTIGASAIETRYLPADGDVGPVRTPAESPATNLALYGMEYLRRLLEQSPFVKTESREMLDAPLLVEIDVYSQIKDGLDLAVNSRDCEIVSIARDEEENFLIEMRRFGHGVGMSQRGAQTMAGSYGMEYTDILAFYYPGMKLERIDWDTPELQAIGDLPEIAGRARPDPTPVPTPAPLPPLQEGEYYAVVALESSSSTLNLRKERGTHSPVVALLDNGQRLIVCGEPDENGWAPVKTAEYEGYVMLEYLREE